MAFINNMFETRSDAFKITNHNRHAIPSRTHTIGPCLELLDVLTWFLTWLGVLTNSALVYLFHLNCSLMIYINNNSSSFHSETLNNTNPSHIPEHLSGASGTLPNVNRGIDGSTIQELLLKAILVSLFASHGFILLCALIRCARTYGLRLPCVRVGYMRYRSVISVAESSRRDKIRHTLWGGYIPQTQQCGRLCWDYEK